MWAVETFGTNVLGEGLGDTTTGAAGFGATGIGLLGLGLTEGEATGLGLNVAGGALGVNMEGMVGLGEREGAGGFGMHTVGAGATWMSPVPVTRLVSSKEGGEGKDSSIGGGNGSANSGGGGGGKLEVGEPR